MFKMEDLHVYTVRHIHIPLLYTVTYLSTGRQRHVYVISCIKTYIYIFFFSWVEEQGTTGGRLHGKSSRQWEGANSGLLRKGASGGACRAREWAGKSKKPGRHFAGL